MLITWTRTLLWEGCDFSFKVFKIHHLDILQWLGGKIKCVSAKFTQRLNKLEADDTTVTILEFEDGSLGAIEATTSARPIDYEASLSILGENGIDYLLKNDFYVYRKN